MGWKPSCRVIRDSTSTRVTSHRFKRDFSVRGLVAAQHESKDQELSRDQQRKRYKPLKTIFSGIQPTGVPHLGNYLGALRQWKQLQDEASRATDTQNYRLIFSIVDLHALTHPQSPEQLLQRRKQTFASLLAIGLDPAKSTIYFQSQIKAHAQLMWYLSNVASAGYLSRMTQWKSKLGVSSDATLEDQTAIEKLRLGLFSYPVLQAADILLYGAHLVPVGEDQQQHVEFARKLARSFNAQYKDANGGRDFFTIPTPLISPAKRIMSLKDPSNKMSKSHADPNSRVLITDSADDIQKKFKGAITDSIEGITYDPKTRPGVSNLVEILKHVSGQEASCEDIASDNSNQSMRAFKEHVAEQTIKLLAGFRDRYQELMDPNSQELNTITERSTQTITAFAGARLADIEKLLGLRQPKERPTNDKQKSGHAKKNAIKREQEKEEIDNEHEPDVTPQKGQGVDIPIAS